MKKLTYVKFFVVGIFLSSFFILNSCQKPDSKQNVEFESGMLNQTQKVKLHFDITDGAQYYDLSYLVEFSNDYPFYNLYLKYWLLSSKGDTIGSSLDDMNLANPSSGETFGSGFGKIKTHKVRFLHKVKFPSSGTYTLECQHYMRVENLMGIYGLGVEVLPCED